MRLLLPILIRLCFERYLVDATNLELGERGRTVFITSLILDQGTSKVL